MEIGLIIIILKAACLTLGIMYGYSNTAKLIYKKNVSNFQVYTMSIGLAGFIVLQFCL